MKTISIISGSPRKGKESEQIAQYIEESLKGTKDFSTELIRLSGKDIQFCKACNACKHTKECIIKDDCKGIFQTMADSDAIIMISPVYFSNVTAQLKTLFDRSIVPRRDSFRFKGKFGAAIAVGHSRNGGQEHTVSAIHNWMHLQGIIPIGDASHFGGIVVDRFKEDTTGKKTIDDTMDFLKQTMKRLK